MVNSINGKIYVGQTVRTLQERIDEHCRHDKIVVDKAIQKYGIENFFVDVIDHADSVEELNRLEIKWIEYYNSIVPHGYNQCRGGENTVGFHHRQETKIKMKMKKIDIFNGSNNPFYGKHHSIEQRTKWSVERKGRDTSKARHASMKKHKRKVINIDTGSVFNSVKEAAERYGLKDTHITRVCRGKRKRTGGYRWAYYEKYKNKNEQMALF